MSIKKQLRRGFLLVLCFALMLTLTACTGKTELTAAEKNRIEELGNVFMEDIKQNILPDRETPTNLTDLGILVVADNKTYNASLLGSFYEDYRVGQNTQLTTVISTTGFVVVRVVFEGSTGCYFRYEYDPFNENSITITSQPVDKITVVEDTKLNKVELTLIRQKKENIVFSFRNLVREE